MTTSLTGTETWDDGSAINTYSNAAQSNSKTLLAGKTYKLIFDGTYKSMYSATSNLRGCLISVDHWGASTGVTAATYGFYYSNKLVSMPAQIPTTITKMDSMFANAFAFNGNIGSWNTANVTTMNGMFNQATVFNQYIKGWNVSKVTDSTNFRLGSALTAANSPF